MAILNEFHFNDRLATSGQPSAEDFGNIGRMGFDAVINLAMPDHEQSLANEGTLVTAQGMAYVHIPVPFDAPTEEHYQSFCGVMQAWQRKRLWVHCIVNARVSAFLFRYLQDYAEHTAERAQSPLLEQWLPQMDEVWNRFIAQAPVQPGQRQE